MRSMLATLSALVALAPGLAAAERLPTTVTPEHYDLAFVVDVRHSRFVGTETIRISVAEPTSRIVLNAADIEFSDVTIGRGAGAERAGVVLDAANQTATFTVPTAIARGSTDIHLRYTGVLNDQLRGFYLSKGPARNYAVTQFESTDARRAFPSFDEPAFKATFAVTLTIDRGDTAISNGRVISDTPGPAVTQHTVTFATTPRMSTYLVAMAVGDFQCLDGAADNVPIRICATPDKKNLGRIALESAQQILKFYDRYFGIKYPFGKLDVVAVPDFAAGAMENTAAIFYREADLLADAKSASVETRKTIASILAHEMAHQWFGDLVTMAWWDDIWLNEGFATWMANKPLAAARSDWNIAVDESAETQKALTVDSLNATRPVHADVSTPAEIDEAFDAIAYEKGAAVLRMVEHYVGEDAFRKGINTYLQAHAYKNATSEDFWGAIASASGKPVERILPTFVNQPGVPLLEVGDVACNVGRTATHATFTQRRFTLGAPSSTAGRWQLPVCVSGAHVPPDAACHLLTEPRQTVTVADGCVTWIFANAGARGYYRTAYTPETIRALAPHIQGELTAAERLSLLDDEWALMRAGRHDATSYLTIISAFGQEHASGILDDISGHIRFIHEYLTTASSAPTLEAFVRSLFQPLLNELGLTPGASEPDDRRALRAAVVQTLGVSGNHREVVARARAVLDRSLGRSGAVVPLEPSLATAVTMVAATHGDLALFDALVAAADRAASPDDHYRLLSAITRFQDPVLIDRGLQLQLTPQIRSQDTALFLAGFLGNPAARARARTFEKANWVALGPKMKLFGADATLIGSLGSFCDAAARADVASFFAAHPLPAATRTLSQTLERIDNCAAVREAQTGVVERWLGGR
jgi:aminopeptidase N